MNRKGGDQTRADARQPLNMAPFAGKRIVKIVYLNPIGAIGGAERSLLDLMGALRAVEPQIEMHLIACTEGPLIDLARQLGIEAQTVPMPPVLAQAGDSRLRDARWRRELDALAGLVGAGLAARRYAGELREVIQHLRPDLIHSNGIKCHLLTGLARVPDTPLIWHLRDFVNARPLVGRLLRYAARAGTTVIANSNAVADDVRAMLGRKSPLVPVHVIYNGIDTDAFSPGQSNGARLDTLANLAPAGPDLIRIGLVATYARWKGQDLFLQAAQRVLKRHPSHPIRFYIIGGPIYQTAGSQFSEAELRALADQLGVSSHVGFVPFQDDAAPMYRSLDIVVHTSTQPEPFGRTIVESMSCGRATIVSPEGGARELFTDGEDAVGFIPRNADSLAQTIVRLAQDPALRQRLGAAARQSAVSRFSRTRMAEQVRSMYRDLTR